MRKLALLFGFCLSTAQAAPFAPSGQVPELIAKAQQAYLAGDFSLAVNTLKAAYMNSTENAVAQKNVIGLFSKIRNLNPQPKIDVGWSLPRELPSMKVAVSRRQEGTLISNQLIVSGEMSSLDEISSFQLLRYPDTIVLDKEMKIGRFQDSQENQKPEYNYRSQSTPFAISSGLYLLKVKTKTGSQVDGWFMLDENANSTGQPRVVGLEANPVFTSGIVPMSWLDFTSPQFRKECERRGITIWVGQAHADRGVWNYWTSDMNQRSAQLGGPIAAGSGWSRGPFEDGDYYAMLNYSEFQDFGPLRISRRSSTIKYFSIKK